MNLIKRKILVKKVEEPSIERHPVYILGTDYKVKIIYKNVKVPELDLENKTIKISLPNKYKKTENTKILDLAIEKLYEQISKVEVERAMEKMRITLGFAPEDYKIVRMNNNFIKNNKNKTITINPDIVKYNRKIIETTLVQAFCKTKFKENSKDYKELLKYSIEKYENYQYKILKIS